MCSSEFNLQGTNMELSAQAYKRRYEQTRDKLNKLSIQHTIELRNISTESEYRYLNKLRNEYTFSLVDIVVGSEWYDKQTNEYIGKIVEITNDETHPYLMDNKHSYHPKSLLEWFRLKDK